MDAAIAERFLALPEYAEAAVVFTYLSIADEVDTRAIIARARTDGKTVARHAACPIPARWIGCVQRPSTRWKRARSVWKSTIPSGRHPAARGRDAQHRHRTGLTFDLEGFRMGYGGGFYDTFLAKFGGISIGLCREAQVSESVEALGLRDAHDHAADIVVTDARVLRPSAGVHLNHRAMRGSAAFAMPALGAVHREQRAFGRLLRDMVTVPRGRRAILV